MADDKNHKWKWYDLNFAWLDPSHGLLVVRGYNDWGPRRWISREFPYPHTTHPTHPLIAQPTSLQGGDAHRWLWSRLFCPLYFYSSRLFQLDVNEKCKLAARVPIHLPLLRQFSPTLSLSSTRPTDFFVYMEKKDPQTSSSAERGG